SRTLTEPTDVGRRIAEEVRELYDAVGPHPPVRLIGVRMEQLADAGTGASGLWDDDEDWRGAERVIDSVGERFGSDLVRPASLLKPAAEIGPSQRRPHL
ncbi:MAG: DNA polymerase IV, partial [Cryobacterium sp.]|nr:DNA polymerase IV [Cryobacterium sp.]